MAPKPDVSEARREQIIQAAINVFTRQSFHGARMDDIVTETGLSKGALYWYFKSKEEIIIAILERIFSAEFRRIETLKDSNLTSRQSITAFLDMFLLDLKQMQGVMPIVYEFYALAFHNNTVRKVMQQFLGTFVSIVEPIIQRGMERDEFQTGNARQVALALGAQLEGTLLLWAYDPDIMELEDQLRAGFDLLLRSICVNDR